MIENIVLKTILERRSTRSYKPEQISDDELFAVIEAGRHAPTGGNNQKCHFIVVQNAEVLSELKQIVSEEFSKMDFDESTYKSLRHAIERAKAGGYDFIFNAPTLIIIANDKSYPNAMADSCVAIENMMIAAASMDLGTCYINQLHWLSQNERVVEFLKGLSLKENERVFCSLSLGYPKILPKQPKNLKGNEVTYIK